MTVKLGWYQQDQVAVMQLIGETKQAELLRASEILYDWYEDCPNDKIHLLVDETHLTQLPNLAGLTNVKMHPKRGWVIVVAVPNQILKFLASVAIQISQMEVKFVDTFAEANTLLKRVDPRLSHLPQPNEIIWLDEINDYSTSSLRT